MTVKEGDITATGKISVKDVYHRSCAPNGSEIVTRDVEVDVSCTLDKDLPATAQCDVYHCDGKTCYVYSWRTGDVSVRNTPNTTKVGAKTTERPW